MLKVTLRLKHVLGTIGACLVNDKDTVKGPVLAK
jgi:hypothetical protein